MKNIELLAPAGNLEKLKIAIKYGADAVYFGLPGFSLRTNASQFKKTEIREGADFCRKNNKKFFIAMNIYAHNIHIDKLNKQLDFIKEIKPNGIILSDPGILRQIKKKLPDVDIHISTQANITNKETVKFWKEQGAKRIILAREISLKEVREIKKTVPNIELEYFVHGAMCMAYSGRCILSKWMLNRSANLGDCAQPCRWKYHLNKKQENQQIKTAEITDDKKRFEIKIKEDQTGTYLFNSYDICLIEYLDKLKKAGIDSFKIEGRNKSIYYVAIVVKAYREILKALEKKEPKRLKTLIKKQKAELEKLSNRGYWTGFAFQDEPLHLLNKASRKSSEEFVGISLINSVPLKSFEREVFVHNSFILKDKVEVITPEKIFKVNILRIREKNKPKEELKSAHGGQDKIFKIKFNKEIEGVFLLRKRVS